MNRFSITILFCIAFSTNLFAQTNLLRELLDLPAPPPVSRPVLNVETKPERPAEFFSKSKVPADDAPIEELLDYWAMQNRTGELDYQPEISDASLKRILEACRDEPEKLVKFLSLLEKKPKFADSVKDIYDAESQGEKVSSYWRDQVKSWLKYNTKLHVDKLLTDVRKVTDQKDRDTENEKELFALARVDWDSAAPILERLAADKTQPFSAVSARWAMYRHALDTDDASGAEKYRAELKAIVADRNAAPGVRDKAMDALVVTPHWEGREDWYISLLEDETLLAMQENGFTGLTTLIRHSPPGKWTETMLKLVGNKNPSVHNSAVRNLISMFDETRPEIIVALLPWLSNPAWAKESDDDERGDLIKHVGETIVPEAVPGLIWVVINDEKNRQTAARALIRYKSALAIPALRIALQNEESEQIRAALIEALIASGGFTFEEQTTALEFYAAFISTPEGKKEVEREERYYNGDNHYVEDEEEEEGEQEKPKEKIAPLPVAVSTGKYISRMSEPSDALIVQVIERRKSLLKTKPEIAQILTDILKNWEGRAADLFRLNEIKNNAADVETILKVLTARRSLREKVAAEIALMRGGAGAASGLAACIGEDESELASAFHSDNADTRISVLACARLLRAPLPVAEVGTLLKNSNKLLALAAERYLETDDSPAARKLIWEAHPGEAVILGARNTFNPAKQTGYIYSLFELFKTVGNYFNDYASFDALDKDEEKLRKEVLENADLRMVYAYGNSYIRVYQDRAVFSYYEDPSRYRERNLTEKEFESFNRVVREKNLGDVSPLFDCEANRDGGCYPVQFLMLNRNGGRRVFAYADYLKGIGGLGKLLLEFQQTEGKLRYELEKYVSGLQVIVADKRYTVKTVWKNGDDFRALVVDKIKEAEKEEELRLGRTENETEILTYLERIAKQAKQRSEREFENYSWRAIKDGKLGETVSEPEAIPFLRSRLEIPPAPSFDADEFGWKVKSGAFQIRTGDDQNAGLWKTNRAATTRILEGDYDSPLVSADGKWATVVKDDADEDSDLKTLVRVNLTTNREHKINLPPANVFNPIAFVAAHNKFLVFRAQYEYDEDEGRREKQAEYYLIDPATGAAQPVKGEFRPLEQQTFRPLQPTGKPNEFWAAISEEKTTSIGTYNAKTFTFKPLLKVPEIRLTSMDIWADEKDGKVYFVYAGEGERDGHLLSLPLPK